MNRTEHLTRLQDRSQRWDLVVVGGGATGLGVALDAASRGHSVALIERHDFAKGTSSRSTKLIHGGVRYLQQGNLSLVRQALHERALLLRNAPQLIHAIDFVIPCYDWIDLPFYGAGLKLYDLLAGKEGLAGTRLLSAATTKDRFPTLAATGLKGGVVYQDGQFDDAALAIAMAQTAAAHGAALANYVRCVALTKSNGRVTGLVARDEESGQEFELTARSVINATGVFADELRHQDDATTPELIRPSQGAHLVLDRSFLPGESALMIPRTRDGRVLFAVPWKGRVVLGTTDTPVSRIDPEPRVLEEEIEFLCTHAAEYLTRAPRRDDILSLFAGLRPLVRRGAASKTAALSRDHLIEVSSAGLITITGGKWTTWRHMAEETVDRAEQTHDLPRRPCQTRTLPIPADAAEGDAVLHAVRHTMARTVEDILARRTRLLLLDAHASIEAAPGVARILAQELGWSPEEEQRQLAQFVELAGGYRAYRAG